MAGLHCQDPRHVRYPELCVCAAGVIAAELDSLSQRQFSRKIDRVRLATHITLPRIAPALTPAAGLFLAAKGSANFRAARPGVHICDAAITPGRAQEFLRFAHVVRENGGGQTLWHTV